MKRTVLLAVCFLLLTALCSCAAAPTMDLSGFLQNRKDLGQPLGLNSLFRTEDEGDSQYWLPVSGRVSLRLFAVESGDLYECRVLLQKQDLTGTSMRLESAEKDTFRTECHASLRAFCSASAAEAERLLRALSVYEDSALEQTGALSTQYDRFTLTQQSHPLETAFSIRDTRLRELPSAAVPESRPLYGDTTVTRRETVPHK